MQGLDLGCGVGDVSLLVSKMVGAQGAVLGIDIETRAARLRDDAVANVRVAFMPRVVGAWAEVATRARP